MWYWLAADHFTVVTGQDYISIVQSLNDAVEYANTIDQMAFIASCI